MLPASSGVHRKKIAPTDFLSPASSEGIRKALSHPSASTHASPSRPNITSPTKDGASRVNSVKDSNGSILGERATTAYDDVRIEGTPIRSNPQAGMNQGLGEPGKAQRKTKKRKRAAEEVHDSDRAHDREQSHVKTANYSPASSSPSRVEASRKKRKMRPNKKINTDGA